MAFMFQSSTQGIHVRNSRKEPSFKQSMNHLWLIPHRPPPSSFFKTIHSAQSTLASPVKQGSVTDHLPYCVPPPKSQHPFYFPASGLQTFKIILVSLFYLIILLNSAQLRKTVKILFVCNLWISALFTKTISLALHKSFPPFFSISVSPNRPP